jgi:outer membrane receptor for ferrienterochelin and colicins
MKQMLSILIALLLPAAAFAQTQTTSKGDDKELTDLLNIIQQETDVATKTRLNTDYVPGIVTVLQGDQLEAMGMATAWEALGLVPGVQAVLDASGSPSVVVRGIDFPFNSGNIQILINSVPLSRADSGISASSLLIPIEQVERIEVIRGPGSVVYGDFAFMGLVNIVTRKDGQRVYTRDDIRTHSGGARGSWTSGPASVAANLSHSTSDNTPLPVARGHDERTFGVLSASDGGFKLSAEEARRELRPSGAGPTFDETSWGIDGRYGRDIIPKLHAEASVNYLRNDIDNTASLFQGHQIRYGVSLISDLWERQSWLFGADDSTSTTDQAAHASPGPPGRPPGPRVLLVSNVERRITGLVLQDRIDLSKAMTLTLGARRDAYSDLQTRTTPRVAVVWRVDDRNILKAQYAEGFRPPTFFELYTPPPPHTVPRYPFEVNATTELNYIHKTAGQVVRATLFHTSINDMLRPGGQVVPGHASSQGVEVEWSRQITTRLKVETNASHTNTRDPRNGDNEDPATARWLANAGLTFEVLRDTILGARLNYVENRAGGGGGYDLADFTVSRQEVFMRGLGLRAGVKDAFNDRAVYLNVPPVGPPQPLVYPGRSVWVQVSWKR